MMKIILLLSCFWGGFVHAQSNEKIPKLKVGDRLDDAYESVSEGLANPRSKGKIGAYNADEKAAFRKKDLRTDHVKELKEGDEQKLKAIYERVYQVAKRDFEEKQGNFYSWEDFDLGEPARKMSNEKPIKANEGFGQGPSSNVIKWKAPQNAFEVKRIPLQASQADIQTIFNDPSGVLVQQWENKIASQYPDLLGCRVYIRRDGSELLPQATCLIPRFKITAKRKAEGILKRVVDENKLARIETGESVVPICQEMRDTTRMEKGHEIVDFRINDDVRPPESISFLNEFSK